MFSRNLTEKEIEMTGIIEGFVREKHAHSIGHDYSHIIEVTRRAIEIAQMLSEPVDPFILICGALFHDLVLNRDSDHFLACHMVYNRQSFLFC